MFAFGVLSYRLLTGSFPRCQELFASVAPKPGETRKEGIHADVGKMAQGLRKSEEVTWVSELGNALEAKYREWIVRSGCG